MRLHELLSIEKQQASQVNVLIQDTLQKFGKDHFFKGWIKKLVMIKDSPDNSALEEAGSEIKDVVTTVPDTLNYLMNYWVKSENCQMAKNVSNTKASSDIKLPNGDIIENVPVDELMGLENRLAKLREVFHAIPTIDASKSWVKSVQGKYIWKTEKDDVTTKTEKVVTPVILYEATKEHPAQIKEVSKDEVIGKFTISNFNGMINSLQKAELLDRIDLLIEEVKKARMRANCQEVIHVEIGEKIKDYLLSTIL